MDSTQYLILSKIKSFRNEENVFDVTAHNKF